MSIGPFLFLLAIFFFMKGKLPFEMLIVLPVFVLTSFFLFIFVSSSLLGVIPPWWNDTYGALAQVSALCGIWTLLRIWT